MVSTYTVPAVTVFYDVPFKIATSVVLYIFLLHREDLNRIEATILILLFFAYVYARHVWFPFDFPD